MCACDGAGDGDGAVAAVMTERAATCSLEAVISSDGWGVMVMYSFYDIENSRDWWWCDLVAETVSRRHRIQHKISYISCIIHPTWQTSFSKTRYQDHPTIHPSAFLGFGIYEQRC